MSFFNYYSLSLLVGGVISILAGIYVYLTDDNTNRNMRFAWVSYAALAGVWGIGYAIMILAPTKEIAWYANWVLHIGAVFIPLAYFWTVTELGETTNEHRLPLMIFGVISVGFLFVSGTKYFVANITPKFIFNFVPTAGILYPLFTLYFFVVIFYAMYVLFKSARLATKDDSVRLWYVWAASIAGFTGGVSVFFLTYDIPIPPYPIALFAVYPILISYAIVRHGLFNVHIITTEVLSGIILAILFVKIFLVDNFKKGLVEVLIFVIITFFIIRLIKSVRFEVRQREEAERVSQERSELMAFATHELRNPVTAMRGYASLILDPTMPMDAGPKTKEVVQGIYAGSNDMLRLISQFLNKSKLELGQMEYTITTFDAAKVLAPVVEGFKSIARQKNLELINRIDTSHEYLIRADETKLRENIGDIIDNAIKYTKQGHVTVSIERIGVHVRITIADTGMGIPAHILPNLFKKFSRADAKKANLLGTGVGLYLAKTLIEGSGGRIWAESEGEGKGSRFIIEYTAV